MSTTKGIASGTTGGSRVTVSGLRTTRVTSGTKRESESTRRSSGTGWWTTVLPAEEPVIQGFDNRK